MELKLTVTAGPHQGREFTFDGHDTFLVGRVDDAHLQLSFDDPYFSRRQFVVEINPPRCRVLDLKSRNGTSVNGARIETADIVDGDEISAGHTTFKVSVVLPTVLEQPTLDLPQPDRDATVDYERSVTPQRTLVYDATEEFAPPGYEISCELGRGGMGVVYRATRLSDGLGVAIKTIASAVGTSRKHVERFVRECKILGDLQHSNIVGYHDVSESNGTIFLVMELVLGPDARKVLNERGPLDVKTAVRLICQMLGGLSHAHAKGFVHRDIKPANILIASPAGGKRTAKLADFGLARVYETSQLSGLTMQGDIGGTPAYMAPEQVTHYRDAKPAADQYAAAATLYSLLTKQYPHDMPKAIPAQLVRIATEDPIPIRERRSDLPAGLAETIHKALSREPKHRYPDVLALRTALLAYA